MKMETQEQKEFWRGYEIGLSKELLHGEDWNNEVLRHGWSMGAVELHGLLRKLSLWEKIDLAIWAWKNKIYEKFRAQRVIEAAF
jgi:hypothetical protein